MAELDAGCRVLLLDEFDETAERFDKGIVPDAEIADRAAAAPLDLGRFDDDEAGAVRRRTCRRSSRCQSVGKPFTAEY